jgi:hypothetical protein
MTPGADQAAATAASRSDQERTLPVSLTVPWELLLTAMLSASSLVSRSIAFLMEWWTSPASGIGLRISTSFSTPTTPRTFTVMNSASSRWYPHSAVPVRVTNPS